MTASNGHKNGKRQSLVLYGKDERGKPRAACFAARDALLARKAAGLMGLTALPVARILWTAQYDLLTHVPR